MHQTASQPVGAVPPYGIQRHLRPQGCRVDAIPGDPVPRRADRPAALRDQGVAGSNPVSPTKSQHRSPGKPGLFISPSGSSRRRREGSERQGENEGETGRLVAARPSTVRWPLRHPAGVRPGARLPRCRSRSTVPARSCRSRTSSTGTRCAATSAGVMSTSALHRDSREPMVAGRRPPGTAMSPVVWVARRRYGRTCSPETSGGTGQGGRPRPSSPPAAPTWRARQRAGWRPSGRP